MDTTYPLAFGTLLRRYRLAAGLTQDELAERAHLSQRSIGDLERGAAHRPRKDTVALLADALALAPHDRATFAAAARAPAAAPPTPVISDALPTPPFVGRARELALLERHLAGSPEGSAPPLLVLAGEPGIGKSRLLHAVVPRAMHQGFTVLEGGCQRRGGYAPYAPLLGALRQHIQRQRTGDLSRLLRGCAWLVRLLPELAEGPIESLPAWTLPPKQERRLMVEAVLRFLANVAGPRGTLLVLDDLQWADPDAVTLLATLVRAAQDVPLRVMGAYRQTEVGPQAPLAEMLADLAGDGLVVHRHVEPLTPAEALHLLDDLLGEAARPAAGQRDTGLLQRVVQRTGGVPFFLVSYAQSLRADPAAWTAADGPGPGAEQPGAAVPWDLAHSLRQRVAALSEGVQELLSVAAVVGREVSLPVLAAVTGQPERAVVAGLEAALHARLLEEGTGQSGWGGRFAHDVIREVVEGDLSAARRRLLHRRVAAVLVEEARRNSRAEPVEFLAYHYARSDAPHRALPYLEQAGAQSQAQYAFTAAESYYREMAAGARALGAAQEEARAREKLGAVLASTARYAAALAELAWAVGTYAEVGDRAGVCRTTAQIGWTHYLRGTPREGILRVRSLLAEAGLRATLGEDMGLTGAALSTAEQVAPRELAALYLALGHLSVISGQYREGLAAAESALALAGAAGEQRLRAEALEQRGTLLLRLSRRTEGRRMLTEARVLAEGSGDMRVRGRAMLHLALSARSAGALAQSRVYLQDCVASCEHTGDLAYLGGSLSHLGQVLFLLGDWAGARAHIRHGSALLGSTDAPYPVIFSCLYLGQLELAEGHKEAAARWLEESLARAAPMPHLHVVRAAQRLLAERDIRDGQPAAARERLLPLLDRQGLEEDEVTPLLPVLAWAHLDLGEDSVAAVLAQESVRRARAQHHRLALVDALWVQALVDLKQGCWAAAEGALATGLRLTRSMGYPYAEARLLHTSGLVHVQQQNLTQAQERLTAALIIYRRIGARADGERVAQALVILAHKA